MTNRERILSVLNGGKSTDRLPVIEWASWWNLTYENWYEQGLSKNVDASELFDYFGLDNHRQFWVAIKTADCPTPSHHGASLIENEEDYEAFKKFLYSKENIEALKTQLIEIKQSHKNGEIFVWMSLEGFFWFPRTLFGIENHLFSFYDYPDLMKKINEDLLQYHLFVIEEFCSILTPDFMTIAEDMSYNHGPMLSRECYYEFIAPYYKILTKALKDKGIKILVDTDGDVTPLIPWLLDCGIEGILPLERQAGVDVNAIRESYPELIMLGAYDKTIMCKGEAAMRKEFERILPAMKSGRYLPAVDHQTPPDVSLENYKCYVKLLKEYCIKAVTE